MLRSLVNRKLKLMKIPYRMHPKDFGKKSAEEALENWVRACRESRNKEI